MLRNVSLRSKPSWSCRADDRVALGHATTPDAPRSLLERELDLYETGCACTQRVETHRAELHRALRRVLVIDLRFGWNGLGDSLDRWLNLLRLGAAAGRATYLWMSDRALQSQSNRNGFDLGKYFISSNGVDWRWSDSQRQRVLQSMADIRVHRPLLATYRCVRRRALMCDQARLQWAPAGATWESSAANETGSTGVGVSLEQEQQGYFVKWLAQRSEPWIVLRTTHQFALEQSGRAALASVSRGALGSWAPAPCLGATADRIGARVPWMPNASQSSLQRPRLQWSKVSLHCEAFALMRPRSWLILRLQPHVARLERLSPLIALHVRTGFVDWKHWNRRDRSARSADPATAMAFTQQWHTFEEMLLDCTDDSHSEDMPCFNWRSPRLHKAPSVHDGQHCVARTRWAASSSESPASPGNGTLAAALACASTLALGVQRPGGSRTRQRTDFNGADGESTSHWGLLVLGDSPGVVSMVEALPSLHGRVVSTASDPDPLGNTKFRSPACNTKRRGRCTRAAAAPESDGWTRSIIDLYLGGLAEGLVTVLYSSYRRAMLRRSLLCCKKTFQFSAMVDRRWSRDRSMRSSQVFQALGQVAQPPTSSEVSAFRRWRDRR